MIEQIWELLKTPPIKTDILNRYIKTDIYSDDGCLFAAVFSMQSNKAYSQTRESISIGKWWACSKE